MRGFQSKIRHLELEVKGLKKRLSRIEADLELLPTVTSFDGWSSLTLRDKAILEALHGYEQDGATTLELAKKIGLAKPETSGRTIVNRRLKRIQEVSVRRKGASLVVRQSRKWVLNFEDFKFELK